MFILSIIGGICVSSSIFADYIADDVFLSSSFFADDVANDIADDVADDVADDSKSSLILFMNE